MEGEIIKEYLGMEFISNLRKLCEDNNADFNEGWRMEDKNYQFIKFDLEYVYYKKIN